MRVSITIWHIFPALTRLVWGDIQAAATGDDNLFTPLPRLKTLSRADFPSGGAQPDRRKNFCPA
jgi:hypothetical protein